MRAGRLLIGRNEMRLLRRECERKLVDLPIPSPFALLSLVAAMEEARNCRILLIPVPEPLGDARTACALRVAVAQKGITFILYRPRPTPNQTEHAIFHELAHFWFGHGKSLSQEQERELLPSLFREFLAEHRHEGLTVQARTYYASREERQAELSASLIKSLARRRQPAGTDLVSVVEVSLTHPLAPLPHQQN